VLKVWDLNTGRLLKTLKGHSSRVNSVAISSDNSKIVSGSYDKTIKVWDLNTGRLLKTLKGHSSRVNSVAISSDNSKIVSGSGAFLVDRLVGSRDNTIRVWDLNTGRLLKTLKGHSEAINSVAISSDNSKIVSGSEDDTIKV
jgi:WD40 repeat protein